MGDKRKLKVIVNRKKKKNNQNDHCYWSWIKKKKHFQIGSKDKK